MRELKFRVWDGTEMVYDVTVGRFGVFYVNPGDKGDGLDPNDYASLTPNTTKYLEHAAVMEYTGLKDKNGKEVWEGDIVKCSSGCPHVIEWRDEIGGKYGGGMPGWYLSGLLSGYGEGYAWIGSEEIIGNVYQNPELLKR